MDYPLDFFWSISSLMGADADGSPGLGVDDLRSMQAPSGNVGAEDLLRKYGISLEPSEDQRNLARRKAMADAISAVSQKLLAPNPSVGYSQAIVNAMLGEDMMLENFRREAIDEARAKLGLVGAASALENERMRREAAEQEGKKREALLNGMRGTIPIVGAGLEAAKARMRDVVRASGGNENAASSIVDGAQKMWIAALESADGESAMRIYQGMIVPILESWSGLSAASGIEAANASLAKLKTAAERKRAAEEYAKVFGAEVSISPAGDIVIVPREDVEKRKMEREKLDIYKQQIFSRGSDAGGESGGRSGGGEDLKSQQKVLQRVAELDAHANLAGSYEEEIRRNPAAKYSPHGAALSKDYEKSLSELAQVMAFVGAKNPMSNARAMRTYWGSLPPEVKVAIVAAMMFPANARDLFPDQFAKIDELKKRRDNSRIQLKGE